MASEDELLPLSGLQHFLFCKRQWGLIHLEQLWAENRLTAQGRVLHERAHDSHAGETRRGVRIARGLRLASERIGLSGQADVVEFPDDGPPFPVEYKRGRPKEHRADEVQLCAQGLCLEEMLGVPVPRGALFYGETRRRMDVEFDAELRALVESLAAEMHALHRAGRTPPPEEGPKCRNCSLLDLCQPKALTRGPRFSASAWVRRQLSALSVPEEDAGP